jgi:hypothetical protein
MTLVSECSGAQSHCVFTTILARGDSSGPDIASDPPNARLNRGTAFDEGQVRELASDSHHLLLCAFSLPARATALIEADVCRSRDAGTYLRTFEPRHPEGQCYGEPWYPNIESDRTSVEVPTRPEAVASPELEDLHAELWGVMTSDEYDEEFIRPTWDAFTKAVRLVSHAARDLGDLPPGSAAPDGEGGLRLHWEAGDRNVRLVIPGLPRKHSYIYYEDPSEHAVRYDVSGDALRERLRWLTAE